MRCSFIRGRSPGPGPAPPGSRAAAGSPRRCPRVAVARPRLGRRSCFHLRRFHRAELRVHFMPLTKPALYLFPSGRFYYLLRQRRRSSAVSEPAWGTLRGLFPRQFADNSGCLLCLAGRGEQEAARAVSCAVLHNESSARDRQDQFGSVSLHGTH